MHTRQPYIHLLATVLSLSLALQHCGQPNEGFGHMEASSGRERPIETPDQVSSTSYGPFTTSSGALVTLQQGEGSWNARVVQEVGPAAHEQHMGVGCAEDISTILSQLQHQPADYIKTRLHELSSAQSPTGKRTIYLGRLGLRGGVVPYGKANDTSTSTSIHQAARSGDLAALKKFMEQPGADVNAKDNNGMTALHQAAVGGHLAVLKYLVEEKGANVNAKSNDGSTALHCAAGRGHLAVLKYLVEEKGVDVNAKINRGITALHCAAHKGHLAVLKYLVEEKGADVNAKSNDGSTALHQAAYKGHLAVFKYLVEEKGADVNAKSNNGTIALHHAAYNGHLAVFKYLVEEAGADVNAKSNDGTTALSLAAYNGHLAVFKYLVEEKGADVHAKNKAGKTALHRATVGGHLAVLKYLVEEKGVDVKAKGNDGETALSIAAYKGHLETMEYLVKNGADVNAKNNDGKTVLHQAAVGGHLAVLKYLVEEKGANVNDKNNDGTTALHQAAYNGHLAVLKYLVEEKGANVNAEDSFGYSALHRATVGGHLAVLKYLVEEKGVDVKAKGNDGETALSIAAYKGHLETMEYLVKNGADVNAKNNDGKTVLHQAAVGGHLAVVKYLEGKGADVNARCSSRGITALHGAAEGGHMETILYLIEEAGLDNHLQTIDTPRHRSFAQWENVIPYLRFTNLADTLFREEGGQRLRREAIESITDASRKLKLVRKAQVGSSRKECPHDMGTAFANRFKNRMRREGVPKGMLLDPQGYFEGIRLPESLKTELQTFVELLNEGREGFVMQASSLVALLASTEEESQEISPTPLSWILCPRAGFSAYNPENPIQKQTVTFYTQRSPELAALLLDGENVKSEIDPVEMERALCKYLVTHLLKLEFDDESIKAVMKDGERKGLVVEQINAMLTMPNVVFPTGLKGKLKQTVKMLLTPNVATAVEQLQAARQSMVPHLPTPGLQVPPLPTAGVQDLYQQIGDALSSLNAFEALPKRSLPSQSGIVEQRKIGEQKPTPK